MKHPPVSITGLASISVLGPLAGPVPRRETRLQQITRWPTTDPCFAYLAPPFKPADVVPGLKTRRLDRLSVWALVGAGLALQDAGFLIDESNGHRVAVVAATVFGCLDLSEEFMASIARDGYARADPILFPETLGNLPASHVARHFKARGPNLTFSCGGTTAEIALAQGEALVRSGEADAAIVLAGDVLTRPLFEWYQAARRLAQACTRGDACVASSPTHRMLPGEGLVAIVLQGGTDAPVGRDRLYSRLEAFALRGEGSSLSERASDLVRQLPSEPAADVEVVLSGVSDAEEPVVLEAVRTAVAAGATVSRVSLAPCPRLGDFSASGLLQLASRLSRSSDSRRRLLLRFEPDGRCAAVAAAVGDP